MKKYFGVVMQGTCQVREMHHKELSFSAYDSRARRRACSRKANTKGNAISINFNVGAHRQVEAVLLTPSYLVPPRAPAVFCVSVLLVIDGGNDFDLILAADVVWLDHLVTPLVRTLERLTTAWCVNNSADEGQRRPILRPKPSAEGQRQLQRENHEGGNKEGEDREELDVRKTPGEGKGDGRLQGHGFFGPKETEQKHEQRHQEIEQEGAVGVGMEVKGRMKSRGEKPRRRVLLAYQWRSEQTGKALLRELDTAFVVREIPPEVR